MKIRLTFAVTCVALLLAFAAAACSGPSNEAATPAATPAAATPAATPAAPAAAPASTAAAPPSATNAQGDADAPIPPTPSPYDALPEAVRLATFEPFTGDFDAMVKRRAIRVGVVFNRTHYFIDKGQERGITYESLKAFETDLNTDLKTGNLKICLLYTSPSPRDS